MPGLWWFAETTVVAAGLALVAALASRMRSIGPSTRHVLWLLVLIKLMTPPLISWPWPAPWQNLKWPTIAIQAVTTPALAPVGDFEEPRFSPRAPDADCSTDVEGNIVSVSSDREDQVRGLRTDVISSPVAPVRSRTWSLSLPDAATITRATCALWLSLSLALAIAQTIRILRFRSLLASATPPPDDLLDLTETISRRLAVRCPKVLVLPSLATPMLWCLGPPKLLFPGRLVESLPLDQWRGILVHELAHLRRGDLWVSRLELAAGLIWWWNPLYWLTRARLDSEAELACDAWVVWALPKDRLTYAEVLFDICASLSLARPPAPALGAAGSGRFFERRLTMILHDHIPCRISPLSILAACLLALFALPSWSKAQPAASLDDELASPSVAQSVDRVATVIMDDDDDDDDEKTVSRSGKDDDEDDDADDDDEDDDDDKKAALKAKRKPDAARAKAEARAKTKAKTKAAAKQKEKGAEIEIEADLGRIEKEIEEKLASIEKEIEAKLAPLEKEAEAKLGPEFEKRMAEIGERIGKEIGAKLGSGSEFEKQMNDLGEKIGKEMEGKFGPGSEFQKKIEALSKEMEGKFGADSEFQKKMEAFGKEMQAKFGPDSEFQKKLKEQRRSEAGDRKDSSKQPSSPEARPKETAKTPTTARDRRRERRINELEAQIKKLLAELKALKEDVGDD
jgi:bla regulator protein BlaR1